MNNDDQEILYETANPILFVAGMLLGSLLGGLVGALVMLLLAPQSGTKTRRQIRRKGHEIRVKTAGTIGDGVGEVRAKAQQVVSGIHDGADALQQHGEDIVDGQKDRWTPVVKAGKKAVNRS